MLYISKVRTEEYPATLSSQLLVLFKACSFTLPEIVSIPPEKMFNVIFNTISKIPHKAKSKILAIHISAADYVLSHVYQENSNKSQ